MSGPEWTPEPPDGRPLSVDLGAPTPAPQTPPLTLGAVPFAVRVPAADSAQAARDDVEAEAKLQADQPDVDADLEEGDARPGKLAALVALVLQRVGGLLARRRRPAAPAPEDEGPDANPEPPTAPDPEPAPDDLARPSRFSPASWTWETRVGMAAVLSFLILVGVFVGKRWGGKAEGPTPDVAGNKGGGQTSPEVARGKGNVKSPPPLAMPTLAKNGGEVGAATAPDQSPPAPKSAPEVAPKPSPADGSAPSAAAAKPVPQPGLNVELVGNGPPATGTSAPQIPSVADAPAATGGNPLAGAGGDPEKPDPLPGLPTDVIPLPPDPAGGALPSAHAAIPGEAPTGAPVGEGEAKPPEVAPPTEAPAVGGPGPEPAQVASPTPAATTPAAPTEDPLPPVGAAPTAPPDLPSSPAATEATTAPAEPPAANPMPMPNAEVGTPPAAPAESEGPAVAPPLQPATPSNLETVPLPAPATPVATRGEGWKVFPSGGRRPGATEAGDPAPGRGAAGADGGGRPGRPRVADGQPIRDEPAAGAVAQQGSVLHTVRPGENFWTIAKEYYSSGRYYKALHKANSDQVPNIAKLYVGTVLRIPPPETLDRTLVEPLAPGAAFDGAAVSRTSSSSAKSADPGADGPPTRGTRPGLRRARNEPVEPPRKPTYQVRPNDTLRSIARDTLKDSRRSGEIYNLNRDLLDDPKAPLAPGTTVTLPEDATIGLRQR